MSKFIKVAFAAALALPLVGVAGSAANAFDYPAENDCGNGQPYGAITQTPSPDEDCVGLNLQDPQAPGGPEGRIYTLTDTAAVNGDVIVLRCNNGPAGRDTALYARVSSVQGLRSANILDGNDRPIGYQSLPLPAGTTVSVYCHDDRPPAA